MAWIMLVAAGLLEVVWAYFMKLSEGFSKAAPTTITFAAMFASFWLLSEAMKSLPLGTSYAVWTGIGAVGAFGVGIVFLGESTSPLRLLAAGLIFAGLALMKVSSPE
jgi:quaternary ammonium compound-resistance protein SugE